MSVWSNFDRSPIPGLLHSLHLLSLAGSKGLIEYCMDIPKVKCHKEIGVIFKVQVSHLKLVVLKPSMDSKEKFKNYSTFISFLVN